MLFPKSIFLLASVACLPMLSARSIKEKPVLVKAHVKTDEVESEGDAADDSCIYVNEDAPSKSLVIGTDKKSGLSVYDLVGKRLQSFNDGNFNNVDLRYEFEHDDDDIVLISAGNRSTNTIDFYYVDEDDNLLKRLDVGTHDAGLSVYGSCMYTSPRSKKFYVFVNSKDGEVVQWEIKSVDEKIALKKVRHFDVGGQVEGCVVDDALGRLYIGEEAVGIWQYDAEPKSDETRTLIDSTTSDGNLVADVEGLALYRIGKDEGYLLASSQGDNAFNIYDRKSGAYVGKFQVEYDGKLIEDTDGIDVTSHRLNDNYAHGLLVVQDGNKTNARQSFKYVKWTDLSLQFTPALERTCEDPLVD